ncbi:unnamed protein product [Caenorhabditis auriculariae]|uniref:Uncharacterized protein n=1 Tax=Caenorhabditis auriculariae TaxID=2777116 RepID=A0A8S1H518_9PELO|nr:unnamed protein product [Caenorhabditis auriculariae]
MDDANHFFALYDSDLEKDDDVDEPPRNSSGSGETQAKTVYKIEPLRTTLSSEVVLMIDGRDEFKSLIETFAVHFLGLNNEFETKLLSCQSYDDIKKFVFKREEQFLPQNLAEKLWEIPPLAETLCRFDRQLVRALGRAAGIRTPAPLDEGNMFIEAIAHLRSKRASVGMQKSLGDLFREKAELDAENEKRCHEETARQLSDFDASEMLINAMQKIVLDDIEVERSQSRPTSPTRNFRRRLSEVSSISDADADRLVEEMCKCIESVTISADVHDLPEEAGEAEEAPPKEELFSEPLDDDSDEDSFDVLEWFSSRPDDSQFVEKSNYEPPPRKIPRIDCCDVTEEAADEFLDDENEEEKDLQTEEVAEDNSQHASWGSRLQELRQEFLSSTASAVFLGARISLAEDESEEQNEYLEEDEVEVQAETLPVEPQALPDEEETKPELQPDVVIQTPAPQDDGFCPGQVDLRDTISEVANILSVVPSILTDEKKDEKPEVAPAPRIIRKRRCPLKNPIEVLRNVVRCVVQKTSTIEEKRQARNDFDELYKQSFRDKRTKTDLKYGKLRWVPEWFALYEDMCCKMRFPFPVSVSPFGSCLKGSRATSGKKMRVKFVDFDDERNTIRFYFRPSLELPRLDPSQSFCVPVDDGCSFYTDASMNLGTRYYRLQRPTFLKSGYRKTDIPEIPIIEDYVQRKLAYDRCTSLFVVIPYYSKGIKPVYDISGFDSFAERHHCLFSALGRTYDDSQLATLGNVLLERLISVFAVTSYKPYIDSSRRKSIQASIRYKGLGDMASILVIGDSFLADFRKDVFTNVEISLIPIHIEKRALDILQVVLYKVLSHTETFIEKIVFAFSAENLTEQNIEDFVDFIRFLNVILSVAAKFKKQPLVKLFWMHPFEQREFDGRKLYRQNFRNEKIVVLDVWRFYKAPRLRAEPEEKAPKKKGRLSKEQMREIEERTKRNSAKVKEALLSAFVHLLRKRVGATVAGQFFKVAPRKVTDYSEDKDYPPQK